MSDLEFKITGEQQVLKNIDRLGAGLLRETQEAGLGVGEELVLIPARESAPKKTGRLRRSGAIVVRRFKDATIVKVTFGGPIAPYARFIHENMEARFRVGEAKFLERRFNEARSKIAPGVAARISLARALKG